MSDEKFVEVANKNAAGDGMSEHDRKVLTRKILVKLDFRYSMPSFRSFSRILIFSPSEFCPF